MLKKNKYVYLQNPQSIFPFIIFFKDNILKIVTDFVYM